MSWAKIDDRANEHPKQITAGAKACWLWACGLMYCNRQPKKTGRIPKAMVTMLYPGLGKKEAQELVKAGLWHDDGADYAVHEYLPWNPELREKRVEAGRLGGQRSGEARRREPNEALASIPASKVLQQNEALASDASRGRAGTARGSTPPHPTPGEDPPTPLPVGSRPDPFAGSFAALRPDVLRVHERWRVATGLTGHRFRGTSDPDYSALAEALDLHGEADCTLVAGSCMSDRMVNGEADERGEPHTSPRYVFGNAHAFARILKTAQEAARKAPRGDADDAFEAAMRADAR